MIEKNALMGKISRSKEINEEKNLARKVKYTLRRIEELTRSNGTLYWEIHNNSEVRGRLIRCEKQRVWKKSQRMERLNR